MEPKQYQKDVLDDIESYFMELSETGEPKAAFDRFWESKSMKPVRDYRGGMKYPRVCIKVPTGGGKTFIATCALRRYFDIFPRDRMVVVWLVPYDAIRLQTIRNLRDPDHPYHQRLAADFGEFSVHDVGDALDGFSLNRDALIGKLSVFVFNYDTLRAKDKLGKRMYRQNGQLDWGESDMDRSESPIEGADVMSTSVRLYDLGPLVVLDEGHNAQSKLSKDMLDNLNPSAVLELTATPGRESNVISYVTAGTLKKQGMIKMPIVMYGRPNAYDVISTALSMRDALERHAVKERESGGPYIRPITLYQAQSKTSDRSLTYDVVKRVLLESGVPEDQIAVKVSGIDEIGDTDLSSESCRIRHIITVDALAEGWDCPFAYILATVANKSSEVDVQQIVGRVLRQPHVRRYQRFNLNEAFIITSSQNFHDTASRVIESLKDMGFSGRDYVRLHPFSGTLDAFSGYGAGHGAEDTVPAEVPTEPDQSAPHTQVPVGDPTEDTATPPKPVVVAPKDIEDMLNHAEGEERRLVEELETENEDYWERLVGEGELTTDRKKAKIKREFEDSVRNLKVPRFDIRKSSRISPGDIFYQNLSKEALLDEFDMGMVPPIREFDFSTAPIAKADVDSQGERLTYHNMESDERREFYRTFKPVLNMDDPAVTKCINDICKGIEGSTAKRYRCIDSRELTEYVKRTIMKQNPDTVNAIRQNMGAATKRFMDQIDESMDNQVKEAFYRLNSTGSLSCGKAGMYTFPMSITSTRMSPIEFSKSLYQHEEDVHGEEAEVRDVLNGCSNVLWWHRIISRGVGEFYLNGYVNHYPDFVAMTKTGTLVFVEYKGRMNDGSDSQQKTEMGEIWDLMSGDGFKYYMVFKSSSVRITKMILLEQLESVLDKL